jgi:hypothetical protein
MTIGFLLLTGIIDESVVVFTARFEGANEVEGGLAEGVIGNRYIGGLLGGLTLDDLPFWGYGLGLGTSTGASFLDLSIYEFFNGEVEWSRTTGECGLLLGWTIIAIRCFFSLSVFTQAFKRLRKKQDMLPWILSAGVLLIVPQGQMGAAPNLGFIIFMGGIALASIKQKNIP